MNVRNNMYIACTKCGNELDEDDDSTHCDYCQSGDYLIFYGRKPNKIESNLYTKSKDSGTHIGNP